MSGHVKRLDSFLDAQGRLTRFPAKQKMKAEALSYLAEKFEPGRSYTEREVNELLGRWHTFSDPATLRRALYDGWYLNRSEDGKEYQAAPQEPEPGTQEDAAALHELLRRYNRQFNADQEDFTFCIRRNGRLAAGITACRVLDTMEVEYLCVDEAFRGRGYGKELLQKIEKTAEEKNLRQITVWTYSFQAPGFYEKMGYERLFTLDPCYGNYQQVFFRKTLGQKRTETDRTDVIFSVTL